MPIAGNSGVFPGELLSNDLKCSETSVQSNLTVLPIFRNGKSRFLIHVSIVREVTLKRAAISAFVKSTSQGDMACSFIGLARRRVHNRLQRALKNELPSRR